MSRTDSSKLAYSIDELAKKGPIRRFTLYNQMAAGRLCARKIGRRTVVLDEDWWASLASAPVIAPARSAAMPTAPPRRRGRPRKVPVNAVTEPAEAAAAVVVTTAKIRAPRTEHATGAGS